MIAATALLDGLFGSPAQNTPTVFVIAFLSSGLPRIFENIFGAKKHPFSGRKRRDAIFFYKPNNRNDHKNKTLISQKI
jgi:hypothetical protein